MTQLGTRLQPGKSARGDESEDEDGNDDEPNTGCLSDSSYLSTHLF